MNAKVRVRASGLSADFLFLPHEEEDVPRVCGDES